MSTESEIRALEEQLRQAELGPDPEFFQQALADDVVLIGPDGQSSFGKAEVVAAHRPTGTAKFTRVEMSEMRIVDQGAAAVVTCKGAFEGPSGRHTLRFLRVWAKKDGRWQIVAGFVSEPN